jgi:hypothetical protein
MTVEEVLVVEERKQHHTSEGYPKNKNKGGEGIKGKGREG